MVTFNGGRRVYEGLQTAFTLAEGDVTVANEDWGEGSLIEEPPLRWAYGNRSSELAWGFRLAEDPRFRVFFYPLKAAGFGSLYRPLYQWLSAKPEASGETILPPNEPLPGYVPPSEKASRGLRSVSLRKR